MVSLAIFVLVLQSCKLVMSAYDGNSTACPKPKVGRCVCRAYGGMYYRVTCEGLDVVPETLPLKTLFLKMENGAIKEMPKNYLKKTMQLIALGLANNSISNSFYIPTGVNTVDLSKNLLNASAIFGMFHNLRVLRHLSLSMNPLRDGIMPGTFVGLENLQSLQLTDVLIKELKKGTFTGLKNLQILNCSYNPIPVLRKGALQGIIGPKDEPSLKIHFSQSKISDIEDGVFEGTNIGELHLDYNRMKYVPDLKGLNSYVEMLRFSGNQISNISAVTTSGIRTIRSLRLEGNNISVIPLETFRNINVQDILDLSFNFIKKIPSRLFHGMELQNLVLQNNSLHLLANDSFSGLPNLRGLYLYNNYLHSLPDSLFADMELDNLFLSRNNFTKLSGRPFKGMKSTSVKINLFSNSIHEIEDGFFDDLKGGSKITLDCQNLKELPHLPYSSRLVCTKYSSREWIGPVLKNIAVALSTSGFECRRDASDVYYCMPCQPGTFGKPGTSGRRDRGKCHRCSAGGFFQDELAQSQCKTCNTGTFVLPKNAPATEPLTCQACPQGTNTSEWSGYRACKCLQNFYRFDRFGRCFPCSHQGWTCTNDFASLSEGYYWEWRNETTKNDYSNYINNLMIESRDYTNGVWTFTGSLPVPHKCPRMSCRGGLNSSCVTGYHGLLCSLCDVRYYKRMNSCIRCPSILWATIKVILVIALFVLVLLAIMWGDKKQIDDESGRTIADKILSCFKIVIGFYQVISGVYSASIRIDWPSSVIWIQNILHYIQFNILEIAPLSCISWKLSFNVLQQFVIVVGLNIGVVGIFLLYLVARILYLRRRKSRHSQRTIEESIAKSKSACIRNICVFLFATYPKTCTSIIQVLPVNCLSVCFDSNDDNCSSYLRADFSILCNSTPSYTEYSRAAMTFLFYPIGFPVVIMILVWKYCSKECEEDNKADVSLLTSAFSFSPSVAESPFKAGLRLFSENYKPCCWYWEGLEMIRKLILVSGLTLIGEHSRTQVGLGAMVSALFAVLYVFKSPIKDKFENLLQTISLMAIFLNLSIGTMLTSSDNSDVMVNKHNDNIGVSVLLIIINSLVIGLVVGSAVRRVVSKCCRGDSISNRIDNCLHGTNGLCSCCNYFNTADYHQVTSQPV